MAVNSVSETNASNYQTPVVNEKEKQTEVKQAETKQTNQVNATELLGYVYEPSKNDTTAKSGDYKPDMEKVNKMINESNKKINDFRVMLEKMISRQANKSDTAQSKPKTDTSGVEQTTDQMVEIDEATRLKAQEEISEDGYYGVKQTSERLLDFAKAISGGDPSKIGLLRDAVDKGFAAAAKQIGKELPQISKDTYDAVMKGFDEWEKSVATDYTKDNITGQIANSLLAKK